LKKIPAGSHSMASSKVPFPIPWREGMKGRWREFGCNDFIKLRTHFQVKRRTNSQVVNNPKGGNSDENIDR